MINLYGEYKSVVKTLLILGMILGPTFLIAVYQLLAPIFSALSNLGYSNNNGTTNFWADEDPTVMGAECDSLDFHSNQCRL